MFGMTFKTKGFIETRILLKITDLHIERHELALALHNLALINV